jgi:hypothetical protein
MLTRIDLTLDCANPQLLAAFWKTAAGYVDEPPPKPFATGQPTQDDRCASLACQGCARLGRGRRLGLIQGCGQFVGMIADPHRRRSGGEVTHPSAASK